LLPSDQLVACGLARALGDFGLGRDDLEAMLGLSLDTDEPRSTRPVTAPCTRIVTLNADVFVNTNSRHPCITYLRHC